MNQTTGFRRVVRDIADLCELQAELLAVDGRVAADRSGKAAAMLMVAAIFGVCAVAASVFALASFLHEQASWTISSSLLASAGIAAVIGVLFALVGWTIWKQALSALDETRSEFAENLRWIKAAVIAPESSPRAQVNENSFRTMNSARASQMPAMSGNSSKMPHQ